MPNSKFHIAARVAAAVSYDVTPHNSAAEALLRCPERLVRPRKADLEPNSAVVSGAFDIRTSPERLTTMLYTGRLNRLHVGGPAT